MDDSSLVWIHRLQGHAATALDYIACQTSCQRFQGLFPLFTEVAAVNGDSHIITVQTVDRQACQILDCIDGLAASADHKAQIVALEGDIQVLSVAVCLCGKVLRTHRLQNSSDVLHCHFLFIFLYKNADLCRICLQSEQSFFRQVDDFKLYLLPCRLQLSACLFNCKIHRFTGCNNLFQTDTSSDNQ